MLPDWSDKPVAIVGTGGSLRGFDFDRLRSRDCYVLAVKEAIWDLPFAAAGFGLDHPWMHRRREELLTKTTVQTWLTVPPAEREAFGLHASHLHLIDRERGEGLSDDPTKIFSGGTSGYGAVNLAYLFNARRIFLFGFDYSVNITAPHTNGRGVTRNIPIHHYNPESYWWYNTRNFRYWARWAAFFNYMLPQLKARGISVVNASPQSSISAFPKVSIDEALDDLDRLRPA